MDKVRFAVVGLKHGQSHVHTVLDSERAELVGLCDLDRALAGQVQDSIHQKIGKEQARGIRIFDDYRKLLAWNGFDAVVISTPVMVHAEMAELAVKAKKHVLLEKPMTVTIAEAESLCKACRGAKTVFQVGYEVRSSQLVGKVKEIIHDGRIGDVVFVWWHMFMEHVSKGWRSERKNMGGKLFDCCCHYWDIMQCLAGAKFHRISAFGSEPGKVGPDAEKLPKVATVNFEYQNGVKGNLSFSEVTPTPEWSLFGVAGTKGIIYGNPWSPEGAGSLDCYLDGGLFKEKIAVNGQMASRGHLGFREQHEAFLDAILDGKKVPCSVDDGYEVVLINAAVDRAIATNEAVFRKDMAKVGKPKT